MKIFNDQVVCPRCDGQGVICEIKIEALDRLIYVCDECDATWLEKSKISLKNFIDFETYLEQNGYIYYEQGPTPYKLTKIHRLGYGWYKQ